MTLTTWSAPTTMPDPKRSHQRVLRIVAPLLEEVGEPEVPCATIAELSRYAVLRTLEHVGGSTDKASKILGLSQRKIQDLVRDWELEQLNARRN